MTRRSKKASDLQAKAVQILGVHEPAGNVVIDDRLVAIYALEHQKVGDFRGRAPHGSHGAVGARRRA